PSSDTFLDLQASTQHFELFSFTVAGFTYAKVNFMASQPYRRTDFIYTPNYCEENVYLLLQKLQADNLSGEFHVVFVSNSSSSVALFAQAKGNPKSDHMIVWSSALQDYHVFLIHTASGSHWVFDFDTILDFPVSFSVYRKYGLRENALLPDEFRR
ncbi:hypothetical protein EG68_11776, partial [Paragonimus skrjabini miyazakii]